MTSIAEQRLTCNRVFRYVTYYSKKQLTGRLDIQAASGESWQIYLNLGQLTWVAGGIHPHRRFLRQLQVINNGGAAQPTISQLSVVESENPDCVEYHLLAKLAQEKYFDAEDVSAVIRGVLVEGLFDIVQGTELASPTLQEFFSEQSDQKLTTVADLDGAGDSFYVQVRENLRPSQGLRLPHTWMQSVKEIQPQIQKDWERWLSMGLQNYSPNSAPFVKDTEALKAQTSEKVYNTLIKLMNGKEPLRDLARGLKRDIWGMTQVLQPLIHQQIITFIDVPDRSLFSEKKVTSDEKSLNDLSQGIREKKGLVACVDDSQQTQKMIETISRSLGYDFIGIYESVEALPTLIEKKPDLIFLDLVMPVVNGYELCQQIRRVQALNKTPVVILTGNVVNRVRARVSGANECIGKPVEIKKIREVFNRYSEQFRDSKVKT